MPHTLLTLLCLSFCANLSWAQASFPSKPIRIIIPFPAGAAADNAMRPIARKLGERLGQAVVVDNRPGVQGILAVSTAAPDGYTLLLGAGSSIVTGPLMNSKLPYNASRDFAAVGRLLINVPVLTVHPSLGIKSVAELIAYAKQKPNVLNYSSSGIGSPNHLAMEMFQFMTDTQLVHVPYKGGAPSVTELVAGHVHVGINAVPSVMQNIKNNRLVAIAVASSTRDRNLPDVPTINESGVTGFEYDIWYALFAPSKTDSAHINKISSHLQAVLRDPEIVQLLQQQGAEAKPSSAEELSLFIKNDIVRWQKILKDRDIKLE
jgi:tripartite-type tricarboxylate transporter receptor subunit TctC